MVKLTDDMKEEMAKGGIFMLATSSKKGEPNVVPIGMLFLMPDCETVWVIDNYMKKTLANVKENPKASFSVWNRDGKIAFQVKGDVTVENSGADYEKAVEIAHSKKMEYPAKNLLKIKITEVYSVVPGPNAGDRLLG